MSFSIEIFFWVSTFPCKNLRSDFCYFSLVSVMRNKAYNFTVEDNGIYYKDRNLVHKRNSSFEFGISVLNETACLFEEKKSNTYMMMTRVISLNWTPRGKEGDRVNFRRIDVHLSTTYPCFLLFVNPREIKQVVPNQDIWMGKVLSVPRQVTEAIV